MMLSIIAKKLVKNLREVRSKPQNFIFWTIIYSICISSDLFTKRTKNAKTSLSGPAAKRAKIERKKASNPKGKFSKEKEDDKAGFQKKRFRTARPQTGAKSHTKAGKSKAGFKGASKIHKKR